MNKVLPILLLLSVIRLDALAAELPESVYRNAVDRGMAVYRLDENGSWADIVAFKEGKLARFGHDHVVSTNAVNGLVMIGDVYSTSRADLVVQLASLEVDLEGRRAKYGLDNNVSDSAKKGTRKNLFDKVLETTSWPGVSIHVTLADTSTESTMLDVQLQLHGVEQRIELPVSLQFTDSTLHAEGTFELVQSDYGITPYSALAGLLRVRDRVNIHFSLVARRYYFDEQTMKTADE